MESKSTAGARSYQFSLKIIRTYHLLTKNGKEFILSKQLIRSSTSIGANIHEALAAESKKDFIHKLHIALKETRESEYWLNLLKDSEYLDEKHFVPLIEECNEIKKMLSSIILTTKNKYFPKSKIH